MNERRTRAILIAATMLLGAVWPAMAQDAMSILKSAERALFPPSYEANLVMETVRLGKDTRSMSFSVLAMEGSGSLVEITAPARSAGIRFLQRAGDLLMYSPRSGSRRAIRLSAQESFQGSLFANSDISDPTYSDDYVAVNLGRVTLDHPVLGSIACTLIEGTASHPKAPYGRIRMWLLPEDAIPVRMEFYAKSGLLYRIMTLSDLKVMAGKRRPTLMHMESTTEEGAWTDVRIESLAERSDLSDALFTETNLTR